MDEIRNRLTKCFRIVFPSLPESQIPMARQESVPEWDSVAGITLLNVLEDEFQLEMDLELAGELDSYERICEHLGPLVNGS